MKVVIVGGVAGGATAAARIRRLDEQAEIVVFERSGYVSYANCGLPYYIGGVIEDPEDLTLQTPESFFRRFRVNMKVLHEVIAIHPERKTVSVKNLESGEEFEEHYDKLILSPGAKPTQPRLPGVGMDKVFTLRTVRTPSGSRSTSISITPNLPSWQAAASSVWSWRRICATWAWT
jgi:NADPH-dependent 2,4-dienoyl-CoA reductase/sulfur reductase-like enzyme